MKIAILGTIPYTKMMAPFDDESWEIWVCSPGNRGGCIPRVTRWFELHGVEAMRGAENADWNKPYFDWLKTQSFPVYMQEPNDLCPGARVFPKKAWLQEFGPWGRMGATSSISWMIGYAVMMMGRKADGSGGSPDDTIGVFGVDMQADSEIYTVQKAGGQIMMQLAKDRGIDVQVPLESCLATYTPLYGYHESSRFGRKMDLRKLELINSLNQARGQLEHFKALVCHLEGAMEVTNYVMRTFVDGANDAEVDVDETLFTIDGSLVSAAVPKGVKLEFPDHRPVTIPGKPADPADMDVFKTQGGVLVPARHHDGRAAE